ncbi:hypothetical protein HWV62_9115 [Athelia sp. TMB]|nr:hypothetical protein HWV62_9115 [Athelia sp. TMB]
MALQDEHAMETQIHQGHQPPENTNIMNLAISAKFDFGTASGPKFLGARDATHLPMAIRGTCGVSVGWLAAWQASERRRIGIAPDVSLSAKFIFGTAGGRKILDAASTSSAGQRLSMRVRVPALSGGGPRATGRRTAPNIALSDKRIELREGTRNDYSGKLQLANWYPHSYPKCTREWSYWPGSTSAARAVVNSGSGRVPAGGAVSGWGVRSVLLSRERIELR